jgi:hypothetical protein
VRPRASKPRARCPSVKRPAPVLCATLANQLIDVSKEGPTQAGLADAAALQAVATKSTIDSAGETHNLVKPELEVESRSSKEVGEIETPA